MRTYTDFYVLPVKKAGLETYRQFAEATAKVWCKHGALEAIEFVADDAKSGVHTSFPQAVALESDEAVVVARITFASRADRDRINAAVMSDPVFAGMSPDLPVDGKRMFWGGFTTLVEAKTNPGQNKGNQL